MTPRNISNDRIAANRILKSGFDALVEYDSLGRVVGTAGVPSSHLSWARAAQFAFAGSTQGAAQNATTILLSDMFIAALGVGGGGTLLAIIERQVLSETAASVASKLDRAVAGVVGEKLAPWAVLAGVVLVAYFGLRGGSQSG